MPYECKATKEEIEKSNRRCWHTGCPNTCKIENISGYRYCFKHFFWYKKHDPSVFNNKRRIIWKNLLMKKHILNIEIRKEQWNNNTTISLFVFRWCIAKWFIDDITNVLKRVK